MQESKINNSKILSLILFFNENPVSVNIFLILFIFSYFVVGVDLGMEIAQEKDEIGYFTGITRTSVHVDISNVLKLLEFSVPETENIPPIVFTISSTDVKLFPPGRSPPFAV